MKLLKLVPPPFREFVRERMTVYVYTYGFPPSSVIAERLLKFQFSGRVLAVKAGHRTPLQDMISEVVDYDCYQLKKIVWSSRPVDPAIDEAGEAAVRTWKFKLTRGEQAGFPIKFFFRMTCGPQLNQ